jgi:hypothetical protein
MSSEKPLDTLKRLARKILAGVGLLKPYHLLRAALARASRDRYYSDLVRVYASPFLVLHEPFNKLYAAERSAELEVSRRQFELDRTALLGTLSSLAGKQGGSVQSEPAIRGTEPRNVLRALAVLACGSEEASPEDLSRALRDAAVALPPAAIGSLQEAVAAILERILDIGRNPRFFEFDHLDDIEEALQARYSVGDLASVERGRVLIRALRALLRCEAPAEHAALPGRLKAELGDYSRYVPARGEAHDNVRAVIPDLFAEFCSIRGADSPDRFLEINREYSARQHDSVGEWDSRDLSLLREYERDHHALLRNVVRLIREGRIGSDDEILILGPRHVNEMEFFRRHLGLRKTIGLDLFESDKGRILSGDMHRMPFEARRFKLVYMCNTLTYAYNARKVIREICRVTTSPGYAMVIDSGTRISGPDPLGRSDLMSADALVRCFHPRPYRAIVKDSGKSLAPEWYREQPCVLLELGG